MDTIKVIISFILTCLILAGISRIISSANIDLGAFTVFVIIGILVIGFMFSYYIVDLVFEETEKTKNVVVEKVKEQKEIKTIKKEVELDLQKYNEAKHSFKYLSKELLENIYKERSYLTTMELLALEEELVDRGIIDHSPEHEKLHLLKNHFNK